MGYKRSRGTDPRYISGDIRNPSVDEDACALWIVGQQRVEELVGA